MLNHRSFVLPLAVIGAMLGSIPAHAQSNRTFVSTAGSDSNPCSASAPCRTFAVAITKTNAGGEIDALDSGGFGGVNISKSISIVGNGQAGVLVTGALGISINAGASDSITLRGLIIDGTGVGLVGVQIVAGGSLAIERCVIRNLASKGISVVPSNGTVKLFVSNTLISDNPGSTVGIFVQPGGSASVSALLSHVAVINNEVGITANGEFSVGGTVKVTLADSEIASNSAKGIIAATVPSKSPTSVMVRNATLSDNGTGIFVTGATLRLGTSTVTANNTGWQVANGGTVRSYGDNQIDGNNGGETAPPAIANK